jgi:hypothetical protein
MKKIALLLALLPTLAHADDPAKAEDWNAKFQSTYIWQKKPSFNVLYSGKNSLSPLAEKSYTLTATAYLGARVWSGGEAYLNVESAQGVPFSNLLGMGGFTNGEMTRGSSVNPTIYRQRLFVRQTWGLGGEVQAVSSAANQLAGVVEKNRVVLTAGNFATLDIFDGNAYAHDPHTQFMNWSNMTHASFDYASDARGFGWGVAAEWYQDDWVLRFARMTPPKEPNNLPLDFRFFKHYGDQVEVEHQHEVGGQPGKVRVLAFRNRAVLANYQDAINFGRATNTAPDIFKVCFNVQTKYGLGVNVEQNLTPHVGLFLRAMQADGRSETLAFTEVDDSLAGGLSIQGSAWGRSQDVLGISLISNGISKDRRAYLQAGGISFFIGDGKLNYQREAIFETYYSWNPLKNVWLTADYQRINNPAYNADRGKVDVFGARLHLEY